MGITRNEFEQLYRAHAPEILGYLRRRGTGQDAEDILAETFLVAWRRQRHLPSPDQRRAWLFGTARKLLLAQQRSAPPRPVAELEPRPLQINDSDPTTDQLVRTILAELPETDRELLTMTAWEHLTVAEAGRVLGLNATAARVRLHRARHRLAADPRLASLVNTSAAPTGADSDSASPRTDRPSGDAEWLLTVNRQ
jgi:RNA polymerase sigma-70 factor, ECF subfamily